jgi:hypothetical protein
MQELKKIDELGLASDSSLTKQFETDGMFDTY